MATMNKNLATQPDNALPVHVGALLQAAGMNYDPAEFGAMDAEGHLDHGFKCVKASVLAAVYAGAHFVKAMELFKRLNSNPHFVKEEAERRGVSKYTIYNMINIYQLFLRSPEKCTQAFAQLDYSKLLELKHLDQSDLEQLAEGHEVCGITLETAQSYSVRELQSVIKSHRAEMKNAKQRILDLEKKLEQEGELTARLFDENQALKKLPKERASFTAIRKQTFQDMETLQGIIVRTKMTMERSQLWEKEVAEDGKTAVIHPLMHLLSLMNGSSKLVMDELVMIWGLNPAIPVNPPTPDSMTHEERWAARESVRYQKQLTEMLYPTTKKSKG